MKTLLIISTKTMEWIPIDGNEKLFDNTLKMDGDCHLKFSNGKVILFNSNDYPMSEVTHFKPINK